MADKENTLMKIDDKQIIKQSNRLIEARYNLTKYEQRMMIAICSQLDSSNATEFEKVRVSVADMAKFCRFDESKAYTHVRSTIMRLATRTLQIKHSDGGWYVTHWLQSARYIPSKSVIEYKIDGELKPELLQLKKAYLSTQAAPLMEFNRDYTARLYFILKKMIDVREFDYNLDFFRDRFQLGETYLKISNLKNRILEPAIEEINAKSDIDVSHKYIKEGRTYTKIHFTVSPKTPKEKSYEEGAEELGQIPLPLEAPKNPKKKKKELDEDQKAVLKNLVSRGVSAEEAERIVRRYSVARIRRNIALAVKQKDTARNLPGLIITFIKDDTAGQNEKAKIKLEKEKKAKAEDRKQAREFFNGKPKPMKDSKGNLLQYDEPVRLKLN